MSKRTIRSIVSPVLACAVLAIAAGCAKPVPIGIVAGLTGPRADLGTAGRDGALLRFKEERGASRRFDLIVEDDRDDPADFRAAIGRLMEAGAAVAIGPFTAGMAEEASAIGPGFLFVSPTVDAERFEGQDDNLVRLMGSEDDAAAKLATAARRGWAIRSACVLWDRRDRVYAEDYMAAFTRSWRAEGGEEPIDFGFDGNEPGSMLEAIGKALADRADGVLVIAGGANAAAIVRRLKRDGFAGRIMLAGQAVTSGVAVHATTSLDGVVFALQYDPTSHEPALAALRRRYRDRYGLEPTYAAVLGYEAADLLLSALAASPGRDAASVKTALLGLGPVDGVQGTLGLDGYGDTRRKAFLFEFWHGAVVRLE